MSKENEDTLRVYDVLGEKYLENVAMHWQKSPKLARDEREDLDKILKNSFSSLGKHGKIFEVGSGGGENAEFLMSLGYDVVASDVSEQFLGALRQKNIPCCKFNILKDDFDIQYDGIIAWLVFVHFTPDDIKIAARKIYEALRPGGVLFCNVFNVKANDDIASGWYDFGGEYYMGAKRFFYYYGESEIKNILTDAGFKVKTISYGGGKDANRWIAIALIK